MTNRFRLAAAAALLAVSAAATPAFALRVVTWNLLAYADPNITARQQNFRTVLAALSPDVMITQEINAAAAKDSMLNNVLNVVEPGQWAGTWIPLGTEGGALFWKPAKVSIATFTSVANPDGPRPFMLAFVKPVGYEHNPAWFRIYSVHFKAGTADTATRRLEATTLRTSLNNFNVAGSAGYNFVIGGDTNIYGADQAAYIRLVEHQLDDDGRGWDPLNMPGPWNSVFGYSRWFTQCPCNTGCLPGFSGGGLDDRFDLFLTYQALQDGTGLDLIPGSYAAYGNDGLHFNTDVNGGGFNNAVGITIANALHDASDHLPVVMDLQLPAKVGGDSQLDFGSVIVGAAGVTAPLAVANAATIPADKLRFTLVAPVGFTLASPVDSVAAGAAPVLKDIGLLANAPGAMAGVLSVLSNDVDTSSKAVQLSARVLAHAAPSLDSATVLTASSRDFGDHASGAFEDLDVRVHDAGWNSLQAQLQVTGAHVTGGGGRFSVTGFSPVTIGGTGHTFDLHFDAAGAALDSTYSGQLVLETADEALPGATVLDSLVVDLTAHVSAGTAVGPDSYALRLSPPRPNPAREGAEIAFELPGETRVDLGVYDLGGRRVATLADGVLGAGPHSVRWNARNDAGIKVPAGLYFVRFQVPGFERVQRLAIVP